MKKLTKFSLVGFGLIIAAGVLSSCTASFCSAEDTAKIMYTMERGVTRYYDEKPTDIKEEEIKEHKIGDLTFYSHSSLDYSKNLREAIIPGLQKSNLFIPSMKFFEEIDNWVLDIATEGVESTITSVGEISVKVEGTNEDGTSYTYWKTNYDQSTLYGVLNRYGYRKFYTASLPEEEEVPLFTALENKIAEMRQDPEFTEYTPGNDYINYYKATLTQGMQNYRSCVYTVGETGDVFGMYGDPELNGFFEQIEITKKDWKYAWSKGLFEGLLIYPIAYVVDSLTTIFAGTNAGLISGNGWAQIGAILLVTVILRTLIMLISLKTTLGQAKMQQLQPQIAKLQEKYPNSNTNQYEKQRLAQEQMALYKKNKIHPFGSIIVMIVQFPIFISVWGALSGSSALSTGTFYNMNLSSTVWDVLNNTANLPGNADGWWTAFTLILLMTIFQVAATIVPMLIQRAQRKKVEKLGKNNAVNKQNKTMKIVQFVMLAMIIVMGFTLPSAMGVYWIAGAIFSLGQTLITQCITNKKANKKRDSKQKPTKTKENIGDKEVLEAAPIEEVSETPKENKPQNNKKNNKKNNYKEFKYPKKRGGRR